jgi:Peptide methionine sulfoxide reductase
MFPLSQGPELAFQRVPGETSASFVSHTAVAVSATQWRAEGRGGSAGGGGTPHHACVFPHMTVITSEPVLLLLLIFSPPPWPGVLATEVGYSQGKVEDPSYEDVCSGSTGHTEVVQITYDPAQVGTYREEYGRIGLQKPVRHIVRSVLHFSSTAAVELPPVFAGWCFW